MRAANEYYTIEMQNTVVFPFRHHFSFNFVLGLIQLRKTPLRPHYLLEILIRDNSVLSSSRKSSTAKITIYNPNAPNGTDIGSVYVGSYRGSIAVAVMGGQKVTVSVYINCGMQEMEGLDVTVFYDSELLQFDSGVTKINVKTSTGNVRLAGLVEYNKTYKGLPKIADLTFTVLKTGTFSPRGTPNALIDTKGEPIPRITRPSTTPCQEVVMGDMNQDCVLNIADAALIQSYFKESLSGFTTYYGQQLLASLSSDQKNLMDTDKNGGIDNHDALLLARALVNHAKFISTISVRTPDSKSGHCQFSVSVSLKNADGKSATGVRVFAAISHGDSNFLQEVTASNIPVKTSRNLTGSLHSYIAVTELSVSNSGTFELGISKSNILKQNVGITLIQSVTTNGGQIVTTSYRKPLGTMGNTNIAVESGINFAVAPSFKSQTLTDFSQTSSECIDPAKKQRLTMTFPYSYDNIVKGKESAFIQSFTDFLEGRYSSSSAKVSNVIVTKGSIIVSFDMETKTSLYQNLLNAVITDVSNGITFTFQNTRLEASTSLLVDGKEMVIPPGAKKESNNTVIIIAVVVSVAILILIVVVVVIIVRKQKRKGRQKSEKVNKFEMGSVPDTKTKSNIYSKQDSPELSIQNPVYISSFDDMQEQPPEPTTNEMGSVRDIKTKSNIYSEQDSLEFKSSVQNPVYISSLDDRQEQPPEPTTNYEVLTDLSKEEEVSEN